MADQVNPTGSLASGLPLALLAASAPRAAPEKSRPAKSANSQPQGQASRPVADSSKALDSAQAPATAQTPATAQASEAAMGQLNGYLQQAGSELKFQVDPGTGRTFFQIVNQNTGEVVLQVPSDEVLAMARKLRDLEQQMDAAGVLLDKEG